ncbi:MAG: hypothetical protein JO016_19020 [Actinobacteria bacterium]|nr:hypothetical protein [Actinomycetota bacterium]
MVAPSSRTPASALELNGIMLATDASFVLHDDPAVLDLARQVVRRRLRRDTAPGHDSAPES